jgi:RNA polymerase sigma-70 factor (ECF subfamily)
MQAALEQAALEQAALVRRCVSGERDAWRLLHASYRPVATAFLRKLGVEGEELDDACQEVFLQMFRYLPRFRGEAQIKTWLYRLCITEASNARRRRRIAQTAATALRDELGAEPAAAAPAMTDDMARRRIDAALGALKAGEREVFVLFEMHGLAGEAVAELAGCPVATVWRRLHYARQTFRAAIGAGEN